MGSLCLLRRSRPKLDAPDGHPCSSGFLRMHYLPGLRLGRRQLVSIRGAQFTVPLLAIRQRRLQHHCFAGHVRHRDLR